MKSIIICEGETDFTLLQYYMMTVHGWKDSSESLFKPIKTSKSRDFVNGKDMLTIISVGGCTNIKNVFTALMRANENVIRDEERYSRIVIITDNDEPDIEKRIVAELNDEMAHQCLIKNTQWTTLSFIDSIGNSFSTELLLLIIPFEENGALETFLLNSVSKKDAYDAEIIRKGNLFVENADPSSKYLKHRSLKTKAKFDVYFSIRTAAKQFSMRQDILKGVPWEEYENVREVFKELSRLTKPLT